MAGFVSETVNANGHVLQVKSEPMALEKFPPPSTLTSAEREIWTYALQDIPLRVFRARNVHLLREYCRARIAFEDKDFEPLTREYKLAFNFILRLEALLGISVPAEFSRQRHLSRVQSQAEALAIKRDMLKAQRDGKLPPGAHKEEAPMGPTRQGFSFVGGRAA